MRVWPEQATSDSAVKSASHGRSAVSASAALPVLSRVPSLADPESPLRWFKAPASVPTLTTNRVRQLRTGERLVACEAVAPESGPPRAVG